jgi:hypothetical protein
MRGGGGTQPDPNSQTSLLNVSIPEGVTPPSEGGPEYQIIGISATYKLATTPKEPQKAKSIFSGWKIESFNTSLNDSGLKKNTVINTDDFQFKISYMFKEDYSPEIYKFPSNKPLNPINGAYITFTAVFDDDPETAEKKEKLDELIDIINGSLVSVGLDDEYLVGSGEGDTAETSQKAHELDTAIKAAYDAMAGTEETITVPIDEYKVGDNGRYMYRLSTDGPDSEGTELEEGQTIESIQGAELIQLTAEITYIDVDPEKIEQALKNLQTLYDNPEYQNIEGFAPSMLNINADKKDTRSVTIVNPGIYEIEITGASGGHVWTKDNYPEFGGMGGLVIARKSFNTGDVIKVRIGQEGLGTARLNSAKDGLEKNTSLAYAGEKPGGWPNGGNGGKAGNNEASSGGSGGGATEVYHAGNRTSDGYSDETPLDRNNLVLVAGGGGGAASVSAIFSGGKGHPAVKGGDSGPKPIPAIKRGNVVQSDTKPEYYFPGDLYEPYDYMEAGSLSASNTAKWNNNPYSYGEYGSLDDTISGGSNGQGASPGSRASPWEGLGGGGGGYYGGNVLICEYESYLTGSGGGGSNHVKETDGYTVYAGSNSVSSSYGGGAFSIRYIGPSGITP